jgi:hypothetical protein
MAEGSRALADRLLRETSIEKQPQKRSVTPPPRSGESTSKKQ